MAALNAEKSIKALEKARQSLEENDKKRAVKYARSAAVLDPNSEEAWLILAAASPLEQSIGYLKRALEINPKSEKARKGMRWSARKLRKYHKSIASTQVANGKLVKEANGEGVSNEQRGTIPEGNRWALPLFVSVVLIGLSIFCWFGVPVLTAQASSQKEPRPKEALFKPTLTPTVTPTPTRTPTPSPTLTPTPSSTPDTFFSSYRYSSWDIPEEVAGTNTFWIEVDLTAQMLYAYRGSQFISGFLVSTGTSNYATVTGTYKIYAKFPTYTMIGPEYNLPDVPYSMFFYKGYSIHGTYWHSNFGVPMSHGCINMNTNDAAWVYENAPVGTYVFVHY